MNKTATYRIEITSKELIALLKAHGTVVPDSAVVKISLDGEYEDVDDTIVVEWKEIPF